jgi:hypothetical protein
MDTRLTHNTTKAKHNQNEEEITRTHQQQGATGHIRNTKRDTRVQHTCKYQLFINLLVTRGKSHSTELSTRTHARTHTHYSSSPAETTITPSLLNKNPRSKHPIDDSYIRRRDIILSNPQWHLQREKTEH